MTGRQRLYTVILRHSTEGTAVKACFDLREHSGHLFLGQFHVTRYLLEVVLETFHSRFPQTSKVKGVGHFNLEKLL